MADKKISALTAATTPLAGTEVLPIVQSGTTVKVSVANLTAGRSVAASSATFGPVGNFEDTPFVQQLSGFSTGNQNYYQFRDANGVTAAINAWGSAYGSVYSGGVALSTNMVNTSALGGTLQYGQAGVATMYKQYDGKHYFYRAAPGTAGNPISFQEVLTTDTNNNVTVSAGNFVVGTAGKGIDFSANGGDVLSQYDEGTWTPTYAGWSTNPTLVSATYTRIGRIVHLNAIFFGGTTVGGASIGGLPKNNGGAVGGAAVSAFTAANPSTQLSGVIMDYATTITNINAVTIGGNYWTLSTSYVVD